MDFLFYLFVCYCFFFFFLQNKTIWYRTRNKNGFKENVPMTMFEQGEKYLGNQIEFDALRGTSTANVVVKYITEYSIKDHQKNKGVKTYFLLPNRSGRLFIFFISGFSPFYHFIYNNLSTKQTFRPYSPGLRPHWTVINKPVATRIAIGSLLFRYVIRFVPIVRLRDPVRCFRL